MTADIWSTIIEPLVLSGVVSVLWLGAGFLFAKAADTASTA